MPNESFLPPINDASAVYAVRSPRNQVNAPGKLDSLPSASANLAGGLLYVPGAAGTADSLAVSLKNSADTQAIYYPMLSPVGSFTTSGTLRNVITKSSSYALAQSESGSIVKLDGATVAYTLPAITSSNLGMVFDFFVTVPSTGATITAQSGDILMGGVNIVDFDTANTVKAFFADSVDDLVMSLNGSTKGGKLGTSFRFVALDATRWYITGILYGDGVLATPFS
jgi:hypothetical protein